MSNFELSPEISDKVAKRLEEDMNNGARSYNTVYRQASTNLLVVAGMLLAFSAVFVSQLNQAELQIRVMVLLIVISLTASLAFGVIQQLIEAEFFRKDAMKKINLTKKVITENIKSSERVAGMLDAIDEQKGYAVTRWASVVQLSLLGVALLLLLASTAIYLF